MNLAIAAFALVATVCISWTIGNDYMRIVSTRPSAETKIEMANRWKYLVDANGVIYAVIAVALILVNTALICMLKKHASKGKIKILIWWSLTFTFTYGLRAVF